MAATVKPESYFRTDSARIRIRNVSCFRSVVDVFIRHFGFEPLRVRQRNFTILHLSFTARDLYKNFLSENI